ncbi:hypothetical protein NIES3974_32810 [Calothrix sp. NIES-3974]|nr:hypothetical protein NIES3974_32810 [Calothrix sp. NIES-3974]
MSEGSPDFMGSQRNLQIEYSIQHFAPYARLRGCLSSINSHYFDYRPDSGDGVIKLIVPSRVQTRHVASLPIPQFY